MASFGTSLHIPFTNNADRANQQQILKGIGNVSTDDIVETHRNKHQEEEHINSKVSMFTNVGGNIPNDMITPIKTSNDDHKYEDTSNRGTNNKWHRRSGREEDLDWNPSLMAFLESKQKICNKKEKRLLIEAHHSITQEMLKSIDTAIKDEYKYKLLPTALEIKGPDKMDEKDLNDNNYWDHINNGRFITRFDLNYNEWMKDINNNNQEFINEISAALQVKRCEIKINGIRKGSVIIDFIVKNIWIPLYVDKLQQDAIRAQDEYYMRSQDQLEVKYEGKWYVATIATVIDDGNQNGKHFKVRYNPENGKNIFWRNTEWFFSKKQAKRLRFKNQLYPITTNEGELIYIPWKPPKLCSKHNINDIKRYDHIFVNFKGHWRRCEVIYKENKLKGIYIKVLCLMNGDIKGLCLWKTEDANKISFKDMRSQPISSHF